MKIFCIGLSRTGTTTLCSILSELGYRTIHFPIQLFAHPECINENFRFQPKNKLFSFQKKRLNKQVNYFKKISEEDIFEKYDAFGDQPVPLYFKELHKKFPNSKFIFTFRDEEKWLNSIKWNVTDGLVNWNTSFLEEELLAQAYGNRKFDRIKYLAAYRSHHIDVLDYFSDNSGLTSNAKKDKTLLVIDLDKGEMNYKIICEFLEIPVRPGHILKSNKPMSVTMVQKIIYIMKRNIPYLLEGYHFLKDTFSSFRTR